MIYDSVDYGAAIEPPVLRIKGREFTGRLLSMDEAAPFLEPLSRLSAGDMDDWQEARKLIADFTDAIFPIPFKWRFWKMLPASWFLLQEPPSVMIGLFYSFLVPQAQTLGMKIPGLAEEATEIAQA